MVGRLYAIEDVPALAAAVWDRLPPRAVVWLTGEIGSGKTTFVRAVAQVAGAEPATSPTYTLVHEYRGPEGPLVHVDCYRLREPDEAWDLDFPDLAGVARALFIEWPERAGRHAPTPDLRMQFAHASPNERFIAIAGSSD